VDADNRSRIQEDTMTDIDLSRRALLGVAMTGGATLAADAAAAARPAPPGRFADRVALVTGATSGMGAVTAERLALEGAAVVFCGRRAAEGEAVQQRIRAAGGEALFVRTDVTDEAQVRALVETIDQRYGRLDYAFNNVGTADGTGPLHELSTADFDLVMTTNLRGNFLQLKYEIPLMLRRRAGVIVGNSSIAGMRYIADKAHYSGAKHGLNGMYCSAARSYAARGLRINVICPGLIKTEKALRVLGGDEHRFDSRIPMGFIGQSVDVADAVLWLFSDEARYITGAVLPIDGGQSVV
jgi:NAD(P)-dependent dehydrogenase (short-subunit alcohol dehydrogenase family)